MEALVDGQPGPDECWEELAEHALTHDNLPSAAIPDTHPLVPETHSDEMRAVRHLTG